ncbi:MAG: DUF3053 domain-containing protein [Crenarchaeota archaeon]|nr:DUF3053 domain-containing protein [Thermoproteota archaeon]
MQRTHNRTVYTEGAAEAVGKAGEVLDKIASNVWIIVATAIGPTLIGILNKVRSRQKLLRSHLKQAKKMCKTTSAGDKQAYDKCINKSLSQFANAYMATIKQQIALLKQAEGKVTDDKKRKAIQIKEQKLQNEYNYYKNLRQILMTQKDISPKKAMKMAKKQAKQG